MLCRSADQSQCGAGMPEAPWGVKTAMAITRTTPVPARPSMV
jgi:hypothetical protein